ncbi:MAG TPA: hypothetical protein VJQ56_09445, partial [Blastocatellia bacterium]|nr:hypothetical protein [Blastocatellia bacterium]
WPVLVFIFVPVSIVAADAAVLWMEYSQPQVDKAIRLVKESKSRKENFTVQQYFYTTVYHRKEKGEAVEIEGWRASQPGGPDTAVTVEFAYTDERGRTSAVWEVDLKAKRITPRNPAADDTSWH